MQDEKGRVDELRFFGWAMLVGGVILVWIGLAMETSVTVNLPSEVAGISLPKEVVNAQKMQEQLMFIHIGLALFVSGMIGMAGSVITRAIER